ncbi:uncharacterized protein LOC129317150 isoform X2 [Prosopis cineraria]|uniref:uncharacterized protein LOC129317150 isoform X2 n=1 Tax=Prosopis cineraria TaxID=364024 RepID=UPI00240F76E4|nr:uncharacterized protein LOC129317150 isoform X2 [Prosopis cineraria]
MMGKPGAGGRPKAIDKWEHVTVLEGKRVKCKYCGFEFAASANRIKSHIHQIKGQGIRLCTAFPQLNNNSSNKVTRDLQEKEDLIHSQGLSTLDRPRDYNKPNETMLDCYMSPKTMWEGIKALQQTQIHQERFQVGPFSVSHTINDPDLQLIQYVFEQSCEIIFSSPPRLYLNQSEFTTLRPQTHLDSSNVALNGDDASSFLNFVERHKMRKHYMPDSIFCEKIFIPVYIGKSSLGHFYLYIINMRNQEVEIWDSLCDQFMNKTERDQITQKLLLAMEKLFKDVIMFTKFPCRGIARNIALQPNGYDCGIFVIRYMQQLDNYVRQNPSFQFDSDEERLDLALELLKSDLNQEKETLHDKAAGSYAQVQSEEDIDSCGIKKKWVDTWKTISEDVGRGAHMELDDSDNRVKRNNVSLETGMHGRHTELCVMNCALTHVVACGSREISGGSEDMYGRHADLSAMVCALSHIVTGGSREISGGSEGWGSSSLNSSLDSTNLSWGSSSYGGNSSLKRSREDYIRGSSPAYHSNSYFSSDTCQ